MADRCHDCDKPLADGAAYDTLPAKCCSGHCNGCDACRALCWRQWHGVCQSAAVDWRARAIAAEAQLADAEALRVEMLRLCERVDASRSEPSARAMLDAIRAVPVEELALASGTERAAGGSGAEAIRARLLAAGEAAAEGRR